MPLLANARNLIVQTSSDLTAVQADSSPAWNLSDLYQGFDNPRLAQDLADLEQAATEFRQTYRGRVSALNPETIATCLQALEAIAQKSGYLYAFPALIFSADTRNAEAKQMEDKVLEAVTGIENQLLFFDLALKKLDDATFATLEAAPILQPYRHYFYNIAKLRPYTLSEEVEQTRNQDSLTGRQAFIQLRSVHLGGQAYEPVATPDGKSASTDAELSALLFHPDRNVRYNAYASVRSVMQQHNSLYGYILNSVTQDHKLENQMRGHTSTLHKQLLADEVSEPVFRAIMEGTRDRFDLWQRYYTLKGNALGQKIRTCDVYAPWSSEAVKPLPYKAGVETLLTALEQFDILLLSIHGIQYCQSCLLSKVSLGWQRFHSWLFGTVSSRRQHGSGKSSSPIC